MALSDVVWFPKESAVADEVQSSHNEATGSADEVQLSHSRRRCASITPKGLELAWENPRKLWVTRVPLMTLPLAVFSKNFILVATASTLGRLRVVISTIVTVEVRMRLVVGKFRSVTCDSCGSFKVEGSR